MSLKTPALVAAPTFSIVMPAYNVKRFIPDAVLSIKNQTFSDFECIIVDDGSTDKGIDGITELIKGDSRFIVKKQKNGGLSNARNTGLKIANGKYVLFLDSDDLFELELLEEVHKKAQESNADVVIFNHTILDDITGHKSGALHDFSPVRNKDWFSAEMISNKIFNIFGNQVWTKAFKRDLLVEHSMSFNEALKRAEDIPFTCGALLYAKKIVIIDKGLVAYRVNRGGSNSDHLAAYYKDIFVSLDSVYNQLQSMNVYSTYRISFQNLFMENIYYNLSSLIGSNRFENEFKLAKDHATKYKVSNKPQEYWYEQLFDVGEIITKKSAFDMLTYISLTDKKTITEKQTAIFACNDMITERDARIEEITKNYDALCRESEVIQRHYNKLINNPIVRIPLTVRRKVRRVFGKNRNSS